MDNRKRFQIFISSTFADLEEERKRVIETIIRLGCFPACYELFPALDEVQFEYVKKIIDESDYYLLIIGGRYGSMDMDGISYVEKEYDYAVSKGIPVMVFDYKDFTILSADKIDQDDTKRRKLIAFKQKVSVRRLINVWSNADNLAVAVAISLKRCFEHQPRIGWIRADAVVNNDLQENIEKLNNENAKYKTEVNILESKIKRLEADLKKKEEDFIALQSKYQETLQNIINH